MTDKLFQSLSLQVLDKFSAEIPGGGTRNGILNYYSDLLKRNDLVPYTCEMLYKSTELLDVNAMISERMGSFDEVFNTTILPNPGGTMRPVTKQKETTIEHHCKLIDVKCDRRAYRISSRLSYVSASEVT